jgi:hypothetical protein
LSKECNKSFEKLKECISYPPVLRIPDFEKPFVLMCDASEMSMGSVLLQEINNEWLPIAFYPRKFTHAERCMSVYEKEALSVVLGESCRYWTGALNGPP